MIPVLIKHPRLATACAVLVGVMLVLWLITALWGTAEVEARLLEGEKPEGRLNYNPADLPFKSWPDPPWHFVGGSSVVVPLIVYVDTAWATGHDATGERLYFIWIPARKDLLLVGHSRYWHYEGDLKNGPFHGSSNPDFHFRFFWL